MTLSFSLDVNVSVIVINDVISVNGFIVTAAAGAVNDVDDDDDFLE